MAMEQMDVDAMAEELRRMKEDAMGGGEDDVDALKTRVEALEADKAELEDLVSFLQQEKEEAAAATGDDDAETAEVLRAANKKIQEEVDRLMLDAQEDRRARERAEEHLTQLEGGREALVVAHEEEIRRLRVELESAKTEVEDSGKKETVTDEEEVQAMKEQIDVQSQLISTLESENAEQKSVIAELQEMDKKGLREQGFMQDDAELEQTDEEKMEVQSRLISALEEETAQLRQTIADLQDMNKKELQAEGFLVKDDGEDDREELLRKISDLEERVVAAPKEDDGAGAKEAQETIERLEKQISDLRWAGSKALEKLDALETAAHNRETELAALRVARDEALAELERNRSGAAAAPKRAEEPKVAVAAAKPARKTAAAPKEEEKAKPTPTADKPVIAAPKEEEEANPTPAADKPVIRAQTARKPPARKPAAARPAAGTGGRGAARSSKRVSSSLADRVKKFSAGSAPEPPAAGARAGPSKPRPKVARPRPAGSQPEQVSKLPGEEGESVGSTGRCKKCDCEKYRPHAFLKGRCCCRHFVADHPEDAS